MSPRSQQHPAGRGLTFAAEAGHERYDGCPLRLRDRIQDAEAAIEWARLYIRTNGA